jgi:hypothetical protein
VSKVLPAPTHPAAPGGPAAPEARPRWWCEILVAAGFYAVYSVIRNTQGSARISSSHALRNARALIGLERGMGLFHEQTVQAAFLGHRLFIEAWNLFYGTFHFVVTIVALIWLFRRFPNRYRVWRNALALTTALALVGFAAYPLMPPRLLPAAYHFVDTLKVYGSLWSFDSGTMQKISNQYAAMPSLHFAWALWSACALVPVLRSAWARGAVVAYPVLTLFAVVVTANHYVLDAGGGAVIVGAGWLVARTLSGFSPRSGRRPVAAAGLA